MPTAADHDRLQDLRVFLAVPDESAERANLEVFGDKYVKAVTEAMTPAGLITDEYKDGLERLRLRLAISTPRYS